MLLAVSACGCDDGDEATGGGTAGVDDGATLTLWTRVATEAVSKAYAQAYNATYQNTVRVTAYPNEEDPAKLVSAGAPWFVDKRGSRA